MSRRTPLAAGLLAALLLAAPWLPARADPDMRATGQTINSATSNAAVTLHLNNAAAVVGFAVSGLTAAGATLTVEASNDGGASWAAVNGVAPATGALFTTLTTDQQFRVNATGHTDMRLRVSATGSGTITIASSASAGTGLVVFSAPLPAGGNVVGAVTQSGNWTDRIVGNAGATLDGTLAAGTAPANGIAVIGQFNTVLPTLTTGQTAAIQLDSSGRQLIGAIPAGGNTIGAVTQASGPWTANITQFGGNNIATGTGAGGNGIPRVTLSNDSSLAANQSVNLAQIAGATTATGHGTAAAALRVELPSDGTGIVGLAAGAAIVGKFGIDQTTDITSNGVEIAPTSASAAAITAVKSATAETAHVIKASAGNLYKFAVTSGATAGFVLILNSTTDPGNGAVTPVKCYQLPANATMGDSWVPGPLARFATGITIVFSSTGCFTETQSATAFISAEAS